MMASHSSATHFNASGAGVRAIDVAAAAPAGNDTFINMFLVFL
jgi:hypothetical protein